MSELVLQNCECNLIPVLLLTNHRFPSPPTLHLPVPFLSPYPRPYLFIYLLLSYVGYYWFVDGTLSGARPEGGWGDPSKESFPCTVRGPPCRSLSCLVDPVWAT